MALKDFKWTEVEANGNSKPKLPSGAYVIRIVDVDDVAEKEYIQITYDIAEGEHKGHYGDEWAEKNKWAHQFIVSYKDNVAGRFKWFLECFEASNPSFTIANWQGSCDPYAFIGKVIGAVWGTEKYTRQSGKNAGKDAERPTMPQWYSVQDVRDGKYTPVADIDNRDKTEASTSPQPVQTSVYDDDLPF